MSAMSYQAIYGAYLRGEKEGASHMIIAVDDFDHSDYPIYVMPGENPRSKCPTNGDRVMECYRYSLGWEVQGAESRAQHWEFEPAPITEEDVQYVQQSIADTKEMS